MPPGMMLKHWAGINGPAAQGVRDFQLPNTSAFVNVLDPGGASVPGAEGP
jgi:hypothetical protein